MSENQIDRAMKQGLGKVQDAFGGLTGDSKAQVKGKLNEAGGSVQDALGKAQDQVGDIYENAETYIRDKPGAAAALLLGIGVVIGLLLQSGNKTVYKRK